jgi:hypothetical protein
MRAARLMRGFKGASARNVRTWADFDLPLSELIHKLRATPVYANENGEDTVSCFFCAISLSPETERLYGKDAECPHEWATWLSESNVLPSDLLPHGTNDYLKYLSVSSFRDILCGYTDNHLRLERCTDFDVLPRSRGHVYSFPQGSVCIFWPKSYVLY